MKWAKMHDSMAQCCTRTFRIGTWTLGSMLKRLQFNSSNTPPSDDGFFFGKASCTGDINIAGFGQKLTIDAQLRTEKGTLFSLPMDVNSDVSSAQFLRFNTPEKGSEPRIERRGDFSDIQLNLGIDVSPQAEARIIFDRSVGDEIVGKAEGHLDLIVDDLENLQLTGNLEIKEGTYYFTLQNWLSKRFQVTPGGTIVWEGDPYQAEINLATSYATRARLDPLLPTAVDLPGRIPVELGLQLTGALMRPSLDFDIRTPNADSRIQALMANALLNEEEVQRQGLSLLVMNQFFGTDLSQSALVASSTRPRAHNSSRINSAIGSLKYPLGWTWGSTMHKMSSAVSKPWESP